MRPTVLAAAVFSLFLCLGATQEVAASDLTYVNDLANFSGQEVYLCNQTPGNPSKGYSPITPTTVKPGQSFNLPASGWTNLSVRIAGCDPASNAYIATLDLTAPSSQSGTTQAQITGQKAKPPTVWANSTISIGGTTSGKVSIPTGTIQGNVVVSPYTENSLTTPQTYSGGLAYRGINLSGNEFGCSWQPNNSPTAYELEAYVAQGVNTVRIPIRWAYLQEESQIGTQDIDSDYAAFLIAMLEQVTAKQIYAIIDLHSYMRYSPAGQHVAGFFSAGSNPCNLSPPPTAEGIQYPDGTSYTLQTFGKTDQTLATGAATGAVWSGLMELIDQNDAIDQNYLMLDLTNEPNNMETPTVWSNTVDIVTALQQSVPGFAGKVLIEGNHFTGLHSWTQTETIQGPSGQAKQGKSSTANSDTFTKKGFDTLQALLPDAEFFLNVHQYFDSNFSGTHDTCQSWTDLYKDDGQKGSLNFGLFMQEVQKQGFKVIVTEFGGSTDSSCTTDLTQFVALLQDNAYTESNGGFVGWTLWGGGHAWGGDSHYNQYAGPTGPQITALTNPAGEDHGGLTPLSPHGGGHGGNCPTLPQGDYTLGVVNNTGESLTVYVQGTEGSTGVFYPAANNDPIAKGCVGLLGKSSKLAMNGSAGYLGLATTGTGSFSYSYSANSNTAYTFTKTDASDCQGAVSSCYSITPGGS